MNEKKKWKNPPPKKLKLLLILTTISFILTGIFAGLAMFAPIGMISRVVVDTVFIGLILSSVVGGIFSIITKYQMRKMEEIEKEIVTKRSIGLIFSPPVLIGVIVGTLIGYFGIGVYGTFIGMGIGAAIGAVIRFLQIKHGSKQEEPKLT